MRSAKVEKSDKFEAFRKRLLSELKEYQYRVERARAEGPVDSEPDDIVGVATRSSHREMAMGTLERHLQTIIEIEKALVRIEADQYATCVVCQDRIPDKRLQAIPWTRVCVQCAGGRPQFPNVALGLNPNHA